jgi:PAS domain S-box-containing protein
MSGDGPGSIAQLVARARDVERFRDQPVPRELLDQIIDGATASWPARFPAPPFRVMVVVGEERERLVGRVAEALARHWGLGPLGPRGLASEAVLDAPALLLVFSTVPASEGVEAFGLAAGAAQNLVLLARAHGLGSHRIFSAHVVPEAAIDYAADFLGPEIRGGELVTLLAMGWPDGDQPALPRGGVRATWVGAGDPPALAHGMLTPAQGFGDLRPPAQVLRSPGRERVLAVDPYPYNRALLEAQLSRGSYAVEVFSDGAALEARVAQGGEPELYVISDTLPDTTAFELVRRLKGREHARAAVIATTSRRDAAFRIAGLSAGVDYYVRKPVNAVELFTAARILLDRRRLLAELERATALQEALLAAMHSVGVVALDEQLRVVYASPGVTRLTGFEPAELIGRPPALGVDGSAPRIGTARDFPRVDLQVKRKDGTVFDAELLRSAMRDASGGITGYVGVLIDIDERKRMERDLRSANSELERLLGELRTTQARLVQHAKMAALGQLVAGVAHEINTPLAAVVSNNDLFQRCFVRLDRAVKEKGLGEEPLIARDLQAVIDLSDVTRQACARITDIVRTLRTFARLDEADVKAVDLHEGLESTLVLVAHLIKGGIRVERRYGELPRVECHPNQVNQVFMNLIVNACQAMGDSGTLTLTTRTVDGGEVEVRIADSGVGIASDKLQRIFDPGFTTKGALVGTGLGLSIVYQIVEGHGGSISVESQLGRGTEFTLRLPVRHLRPRESVRPG